MKNNYIIGSKNEAFGPGSIQNAITDTLVKTKGAIDAKLIEKNVSENGTYSASAEGADGFKKVVVDVPNTYFLSDEGKVVSNGNLVTQTSSIVTENGVVDTTLIDSVDVNVPGPEFSASPDQFRLITNIRNLNVQIPSGVTTIGNNAFSGCTGLTSIEIPSGVTTIDNNAFYGCTGLTTIEIPSEVTTISNSAFFGCTNISIVVHKAEGSITGAPWGATNATVIWDG